MEKYISKEYKKQLQEYHKTHQRWGGAVRGRQNELHMYMKMTNSSSILDYGAGNSDYKRTVGWTWEDPGYTIHEYEPGKPELAGDPPICDASICIDVMEHVETDKVDNVIKHIYDKTNNWTYQTIALTAASGSFSERQNLHLTIKPADWWLEKLTPYWDLLKTNITGGNILHFIGVKKS